MIAVGLAWALAVGAAAPPPPHERILWPDEEFDPHPIRERLPVEYFKSIGVQSRAYHAFGPLSLPSRSPMQVLRMTFTPATPMTIGEGRLLLRESFSWANLWAYQEGLFRIDMEVVRMSTSVFYGLTDSIQIGIEVGSLDAGGGFADRYIEGFHDTFRIPQQDRDAFARDEFAISLQTPNGGIGIIDEPGGPQIEDPVMHLQVRLSEGHHGSPVTMAGVHVRFAGDRERVLQPGRGLDVGAFISAAKSWGDFLLYGSVMAAYYDSQSFRGLPLRPWQWSVLGAAEFRASQATSLVAQILVTRGAVDDFGELSKPSHEISIGTKTELSPGVLFEAAILENLFLHDNSPDFGFHMAMTWAL